MKKNFKLSLNGCLILLAIFSVGINQTVFAKAADTNCFAIKNGFSLETQPPATQVGTTGSTPQTTAAKQK